jgi:hypothetical protein
MREIVPACCGSSKSRDAPAVTQGRSVRERKDVRFFTASAMVPSCGIATFH